MFRVEQNQSLIWSAEKRCNCWCCFRWVLQPVQAWLTRSRTQCFGDVTDDLLWIHRMLVTQRDCLRSEDRWHIRHRLHWMVLPLHRGAGPAQQLHQSYTLPSIASSRWASDVSSRRFTRACRVATLLKIEHISRSAVVLYYMTFCTLNVIDAPWNCQGQIGRASCRERV